MNRGIAVGNRGRHRRQNQAPYGFEYPLPYLGFGFMEKAQVGDICVYPFNNPKISLKGTALLNKLRAFMILVLNSLSRTFEQACEHDDAPRQSKYKRVEVYNSGWRIQKGLFI